MLNNFLCESEVYHSRKSPFKNHFTYKVCSIFFDIKNINKLNNLRLISINKFNIFSIYMKEYGNLKSNLYSFITKKLRDKYNTKKKNILYFFSHHLNFLDIYLIQFQYILFITKKKLNT